MAGTVARTAVGGMSGHGGRHSGRRDVRVRISSPQHHRSCFFCIGSWTLLRVGIRLKSADPFWLTSAPPTACQLSGYMRASIQNDRIDESFSTVRTCMSTHASTRTSVHVYTHVCTHVYTRVYTHVYARLYTCLYTCLHTRLHTRLDTSVHMSVHMSPHMCIPGEMALPRVDSQPTPHCRHRPSLFCIGLRTL